MTPGHAPRVLIVDDERHNRQILEVMLAADGYVLETAVDGHEALALIAQSPPDLVLLDVMMPGMDGYQVAGKIKSGLTTRNIPIIMVTALDDRNSRMFGLSAGAEDFLSKPVDRAELRMRVRNLLRLKAYADYHDNYSQLLETEVTTRTSDLVHERDSAQRVLDTVGVILLSLDLKGRITLVNRYASSVLGWTAEELLGQRWLEHCVPERLWGALRDKFTLLTGGQLPVFENPIITKMGVERMIEWRNSVVRDDAGEIIGTLSSGTDVTDKRDAVEALQTVEERMRFALENANVGIWDLDWRTGAVQWSTILEKQYGLNPGEFGGTLNAFMERVHPDERAALMTAIAAAAKSGADFSVENRTILPDGSVRWLNSIGRFELDAHGHAVRAVGISQDVTSRRTLETQFQQAQKMEAVGRLASGIAHDFNNLLTVILGFTQLVAADAELPEPHLRDLEEVIKSADRAAGLTKQLLAFSRQQVLQIATLDVNRLITDMTGMLRRLIGEHVEIVLALGDDLPTASGDHGQLEQVIMNLVVNARDAMPDGGTITIETMTVDLEDSIFHDEPVTRGSYVMLTVTDTGSGMTEETRRRLFEPFYTTKDVGKGTGLGLATTYGIIKQSQGHIWVYSELGCGTTFKVYLPRATAPAAPLKPLAAVGTTPPRATETVLLVEDAASVRLLARRMLDSAGYHVFEAENGDDAEVLFDQHADVIDLVITDMVMPGTSGPELIRRLHSRRPELKVLYMSGYPEHSNLQRLGDQRGHPFVQKPFTATEFLNHVTRALESSPSVNGPVVESISTATPLSEAADRPHSL